MATSTYKQEIVQHIINEGVDRKKILTIAQLEYMEWNWLNLMEIRKMSELVNDCTIFSCNCAGGFLYNTFGCLFKSPLINMWLTDEDYMRFLRCPKKYMESPLDFVGMSKIILDTGEEGTSYPVFSLLDIKLHMNHYTDIDEAREKWNLRKERINWDNIFVLMATDYYWIAKEFDDLPYEHKACVIPFAYNKLKSNVTIDRYECIDNYSLKCCSMRYILNRIAEGRYPHYLKQIIEKMVE